MIYKLDAIDAYNQKLVKKINVKSIEFLHDKSEKAYMYLGRVEISKQRPVAFIEIDIKNNTSMIRRTKK